MKKILLLLILSFPFVLQAQNVYSYIEEPICWTINGLDSSLTRIYLVSDRTPDQRLLLYTINAAFDTVSVTTDSIRFGWCDCCGGNSGGDLSPWKDAAGNNTNDASIYVQRTGDVSIGVNDNSHNLRLDGDFQFQFPNNTGVFDWRTSASSDWDRTGLLLQDNGELNNFPFTGRNVFGLAANNGSIFDRTILGAILWAGTDPVGGDLSTTSGILAQADGNWSTGDLSTQLNFFITKDLESLPSNAMTLQSDGRLELDEYTNFNDGVPNSMVWYENTDKDLFKTDIAGTPSSGDVIKVNSAGTGLEWAVSNNGIIDSLPIADIDIVTDNVLKFTRSTLPFFSDVNVIELDYQTANFFSSPALKINNSISPGQNYHTIYAGDKIKTTNPSFTIMGESQNGLFNNIQIGSSIQLTSSIQNSPVFVTADRGDIFFKSESIPINRTNKKHLLCTTKRDLIQGSLIESITNITIDTLGNVGIGLDSIDLPSEKLEVEGNIKLRDENGTNISDIVGNNDNRGVVNISGAKTGSYTFNVNKPNANYVISTSIEIQSGSPSASELIVTVSKSTSGITFTLFEGLEVGESVNINWILVQ